MVQAGRETSSQTSDSQVCPGARGLAATIGTTAHGNAPLTLAGDLSLGPDKITGLLDNCVGILSFWSCGNKNGMGWAFYT